MVGFDFMARYPGLKDLISIKTSKGAMILQIQREIRERKIV